MFKYGIEESEADYWCHICPKDLSIYIYKRSWMVLHMKAFPIKEIPTAIGHVVPCAGIPLFYCPYRFTGLVQTGPGAEDMLERTIRSGGLHWRPEIPLRAARDDQLHGIDFFLPAAKVTIECKLDLPGGIAGTGNLFVQTHERRGRDSSPSPAQLPLAL